MKQATCVLAGMVLAVTVGCTPLAVPASPPPVIPQLNIYHTPDTTALIDAVMATDFERDFDTTIQAESNQHHALLTVLDDGTIDYFVTHHHPIREQNTLWVIPLVQDGLAIIKHPANPVTQLSQTELQQIYRGFITNWDELTGDDQPIDLYTRQSDSALHLEFERLVMGNQRITPNAQLLTSTEQMLTRIASNENAIGYIPISSLDSLTSTISIDGITASVTSLEDNSYPFRMTIYGVGRIAPTALYRDLFIWSQSLDADARGIQFAPLPR